ncbi:glycosyltransferase family 2 protein [Acidihalobacter ferrooxydans]|uniref:Glycosyltransferase 2-like domain-containing protein n=1 Tax=Acidihalobacter ferrooxydans TaxID=1765967 RepID=A0A1P8UHZ7_9GAMM|nr:glycosyltransferase family 2 protein [Acidihalobacter ferrooxydans]APZ43475.1 hypothetical protein BW247_10560 [Acidihalobacter ferrooxydans]
MHQANRIDSAAKSQSVGAASEPEVCSVILTYNEVDAPLECFRTIRRQDYAKHRVIVVDNGSEAPVYEALERSIPAESLVRIEANKGFTGGMNVGIQRALETACEYIWILNNDVLVPDGHTLRALIKTMIDSDLGLCTPTIVDDYDPKRVRRLYGYSFDEHLWATPLNDADDYETRRVKGQVVCLPGTALLIKADVLRQLGSLDEDYFIQWEDMDFGLRAHKAHVPSASVTSIEINHGFVPAEHRGLAYHYYDARNQILLRKKHLCGWDLYKSLFWGLFRIREIMKWHEEGGRAPANKALMLGLYDGMIGRRAARAEFNIAKHQEWLIRLTMILVDAMTKAVK